jgi:hypothetical protein
MKMRKSTLLRGLKKIRELLIIPFIPPCVIADLIRNLHSNRRF